VVEALQAAAVVAWSAGDMLKMYLAKQLPLILRKGEKGKESVTSTSRPRKTQNN
jgi:hypothetical protein